MNTVVFSNNAETYIVKNVGLDDTTLSVVDGGMVHFPKLETGDYFYARIIHADDASITEYVKVIGIDGDTLTVQRGIDNTTPTQFPVNSRLRHTLSESGLYDAQTLSRIPRKHDSDTSEYGSGDGMQYGHVKLSDDFDTGEQAKDGVVCTPQALRRAIARLTALPKEQLFTSSTTWTCPETGTYTITCVGGGGNGGTGGYLGNDACQPPNVAGEVENCTRTIRTGGGGGGGGAGQTITKAVQCTKGFIYDIIIGASNGVTRFGNNQVVGLPGGNGGTGGNGYVKYSLNGDSCSLGTNYVGGGGALGTSYGTGGTGGGVGNGDYYRGGYCYCPYRTVYGGGGGTGANSIFGTYGNGGNGGEGQRMTNPGNGRCNPQGPWGGSAGTQGCIKIVYPLGK